MTELLPLIPLLPMAGFLVLAFAGSRIPARVVGWIGAGSVGISAAVSLAVAAMFIGQASPGTHCYRSLWTWMSVGSFEPRFSFLLDPVSLVFILVITVVGFFIHLYAVEFMEGEEGYGRFFASMNLFVSSMLILVLAGDFLLLYVGWEGVGLCSYLLIGFWYKDPANGLAARKAFVMTRVGDTAMAIGLFLLVENFGTLDILSVVHAAGSAWPRGSGVAVAASALILAGAVGKSAQIPLQTWLPDAMAGPTPVSALIHAATMVTAGVYLVVRTNALFLLAPEVMQVTAVIGSVTLLVAGLSALVQTNIKKVLAYSTISQIGYMFLALGVGAWSAALFHFVTHAFFKALLFLGAGAVIIALDHEHDMTRMGGLRKKLPVPFWTFIAGGASLAALPLVTAGFYSKDGILLYAFAGEGGSPLLWGAGVFGAFTTALYTFRMIFTTFFGEEKTAVTRSPGWRMLVPLLALAVFSIGAGFIEMPGTIADVRIFSTFLSSVLPSRDIGEISSGMELLLQAAGVLATLLGLAAAYVLYMLLPRLSGRIAGLRPFSSLRGFLFNGWGFDRLYGWMIVAPFTGLSGRNRDDKMDLPVRWIAFLALAAGRLLGRTQSGVLRWYVAAMVLGALLLIGMAVVL